MWVRLELARRESSVPILEGFRLMLGRNANPNPYWRLLGRCLRRVVAAASGTSALISSNGGYGHGRH